MSSGKAKEFSKTVSSIAATAVISIVANYSANSVHSWDSVNKWKIRHCVFNKKEFKLVENKSKNSKHCYITGSKAAEGIKTSLERGLDHGGLYVLAAPAHSGKSAHLQEVLPKFLLENDTTACVVKFDAGDVLSEANLREKLEIPKGRSFAEFLPQVSWIIIDQFDRPTIDANECNFFTSLATSSFNSNGGFSVMISVSHAKVFKAILTCNSKMKIIPVCDPMDFQVDADIMKTYISAVKPTADVNSIIKEYGKFRSIGIIYSVVQLAKAPLTNPDWASFSIVYEHFYNPSYSSCIRSYFI